MALSQDIAAGLVRSLVGIMTTNKSVIVTSQPISTPVDSNLTTGSSFPFTAVWIDWRREAARLLSDFGFSLAINLESVVSSCHCAFANPE